MRLQVACDLQQRGVPSGLTACLRGCSSQPAKLPACPPLSSSAPPSPAAGSYSSNVNLAVENSSWSDEQQLQEMYLSRKSFAFNSDRPGAGGEMSRCAPAPLLPACLSACLPASCFDALPCLPALPAEQVQ